MKNKYSDLVYYILMIKTSYKVFKLYAHNTNSSNFKEAGKIFNQSSKQLVKEYKQCRYDQYVINNFGKDLQTFIRRTKKIAKLNKKLKNNKISVNSYLKDLKNLIKI